MGADGLCFVIQNTSTDCGTFLFGDSGGGLSADALNVKFDSFDPHAGGAGEPIVGFVEVRAGSTVVSMSNLLDFPFQRRHRREALVDSGYLALDTSP